MSKFSKTLLLATCAGVCSIIFWLGAGIVLSSEPISVYQYISEIHTWRRIYGVFGFFLLGFVPCLIFGTPLLLVIERFFSRFKTRYITGGFIAGWVAWLFTNGPLFEPNVWFVGYRWVLGGINYVGIYIWLGFCTGLMFTVLLWAMGKLDAKQLNKSGVKK